MSQRNYYVFCDDNCRFISMTKEEIYAAIEEATGNVPTGIDDAFITKVQESNAQGNISFWVGTQAQFNAISPAVTANSFMLKRDSSGKWYAITDVTGELMEKSVYDPNNHSTDIFAYVDGRVVFPELTVTVPSGSTITVSNGITTYTGTGGTTLFRPNAYGTWTVTATKNGQTASGTVSIDAVKQFSISLSYFAATINVTFPGSSTCTCRNGSTTLTATTSPHAFTVPNAGTWVITSTSGSLTATESVSITTSGQTASATLVYKPTASINPTSGVTYTTDLSGITAEQMKLYSEAISKTATITSTTTDVYCDFGSVHYKFSVGSSKTFAIDGANYQFIIIGFNHDTLNSSTYYGAATATGKAGITWQLRQCTSTTKQMNSTNTNSGGWGSCAMRSTTMVSLLASLSCKNVVAPVKKSTSAGSGSSTINTSTDSLFLLSEIEANGTEGYVYSGEGTQYAWYRAGNTREKTVSGTNKGWWFRSPVRGSTSSFGCVHSTGAVSSDVASNNHGVSPAFCT